MFLSELGSSQFAALVLSAQERGEAADNTESAPKPFNIALSLENTEGGSGSNGNVAVYPLQDVVTKYGSWWSMGTEYLRNAMLQNDQNPDIIAHVLDINSPGGEAYFTGVFAESIRNEISKPVLTHFNGMCCSAAYYIAASSDAIYASEGTDIVGSIGTMMTIADFEPYFKKMGINIHTIYADQSTEKNKVSIEAKKGNYDLIKEELLNPFAQAFIDSVKKHRPSMDDDKKVYKGATYTAAEAQKIGLIDGIKTLEQVVAIAAKEGVKHQNNISKSKKKDSTMSFLKNILAGFSGDVNADEIKNAVELGQKLDELTAQNEALKAGNAQLTAQVTALTDKVNAAAELENKVAALTTELETTKAELATEKDKVKVGALTPKTPDANEGKEEAVPDKLKNASAALDAIMG